MKVIIQLRSSGAAHQAATRGIAAPSVTSGLESAVSGISIDPQYPPVQLPGVQTTTGAGVRSLGQPLTFTLDPARSTYLVRGSIPDGASQAAALQSAAAHPDVVGVFSDPLIESCIVCPGDGPVGNASDVAKRLSVSKLATKKMDGHNVFLAVVDTGVNIAHLRSKGRTPKLDVANSWVPSGVSTAPGAHPVDHGTMCAYDAGIAAPKATLLDYAVLLSRTPGSTVMAGLLSDAVLAYSKLRTILNGMTVTKRAMVISNSWGMFSPTWDFPPGHSGNYSDNANRSKRLRRYLAGAFVI